MAKPALAPLTDTGRITLETIHDFIDIALNSAETLAAHQLAGARQLLLEQADGARRLAGANDPQTAWAIAAPLFRQQLEQGFAHYRGLHELTATARDAYLKLFERQHGEFGKLVASSLEDYAQASGQGELAVSAVKSALSAANTAYENASRTARQVATIAEAGVAAAGRAAETAARPRAKAA